MGIPNPRNRHKRQPCLGDDSHNTGYPDSAAPPLLDYVAFPDVEDDKRKGVDESEHEHGPCHPIVPDIEFLVGDASECGNWIGFGAEDTVIWLNLAIANG